MLPREVENIGVAEKIWDPGRGAQGARPMRDSRAFAGREVTIKRFLSRVGSV